MRCLRNLWDVALAFLDPLWQRRVDRVLREEAELRAKLYEGL